MRAEPAKLQKEIKKAINALGKEIAEHGKALEPAEK